MADKVLPTPQQLRQLLEYDPDTGVLLWRERDLSWFKANRYRTAESLQEMWNSRFAGERAFAISTAKGYLCGHVFTMKMSAHRVAWAMHYGEWPNMIDHINGIRCDNRISNLRNVVGNENHRNSARQSNNKSGINGVFWSERLKKWRSAIQVDGKYRELGRFADIADAAAARRRAEADVGGFTRRHGT